MTWDLRWLTDTVKGRAVLIAVGVFFLRLRLTGVASGLALGAYFYSLWGRVEEAPKAEEPEEDEGREEPVPPEDDSSGMPATDPQEVEPLGSRFVNELGEDTDPDPSDDEGRGSDQSGFLDVRIIGRDMLDSFDGVPQTAAEDVFSTSLPAKEDVLRSMPGHYAPLDRPGRGHGQEDGRSGPRKDKGPGETSARRPVSGVQSASAAWPAHMAGRDWGREGIPDHVAGGAQPSRDFAPPADFGWLGPRVGDPDVSAERLAELDAMVDEGCDASGYGPGNSAGALRGKPKGKDARSKGSGGKFDGPPPREADPRQVFVAGVADLTEDEIRALFDEVGAIDRLKILRDVNGRSKGVCFLTFPSVGQAEKALTFNASRRGGRTIYVREARASGKGGDPIGKGGGEREPARGLDREEESARDRGDSRGRAFRGRGRGKGRRDQFGPIEETIGEALSINGGPLMVSDFDYSAKRILLELRNRDKTSGKETCAEAIDHVIRSTSLKDRAGVRRWPAYVYTLLAKFDPVLSQELRDRDAYRRRWPNGVGLGATNVEAEPLGTAGGRESLRFGDGVGPDDSMPGPSDQSFAQMAASAPTFM